MNILFIPAGGDRWCR